MKRLIILSCALLFAVGAKVNADMGADFNATNVGCEYLKKAGAAQSEALYKFNQTVKGFSVLNNRDIVEMVAAGLKVYASLRTEQKTNFKAHTAQKVVKAVAVSYVSEKVVEVLANTIKKSGFDLSKFVKSPTFREGIINLLAYNVRRTTSELATSALNGTKPAFTFGFSYGI